MQTGDQRKRSYIMLDKPLRYDASSNVDIDRDTDIDTHVNVNVIRDKHVNMDILVDMDT